MDAVWCLFPPCENGEVPGLDLARWVCVSPIEIAQAVRAANVARVILASPNSRHIPITPNLQVPPCKWRQ